MNRKKRTLYRIRKRRSPTTVSKTQEIRHLANRHNRQRKRHRIRKRRSLMTIRKKLEIRHPMKRTGWKPRQRKILRQTKMMGIMPRHKIRLARKRNWWCATNRFCRTITAQGFVLQRNLRNMKFPATGWIQSKTTCGLKSRKRNEVASDRRGT